MQKALTRNSTALENRSLRDYAVRLDDKKTIFYIKNIGQMRSKYRVLWVGYHIAVPLLILPISAAQNN